MDRKEKLEKLCDELDDGAKTATSQLVDEITYQKQLLAAETELKKYPFIAVNPKNPVQQRTTYAAKQYKELLQQYNNCIKIMLGVLGKIETAEVSPLRQYLNQLRGNAEA